jgi:hypothetical protein
MQLFELENDFISYIKKNYRFTTKASFTKHQPLS